MLARAAGSALLLALVACTAQRTEKGGLVPLPVAQEQLDGAHAGRRLALVVGIDQFADPGWRPLRFAAKDAADMSHALSGAGGGGFEVHSAGSGGEVTRADFMAQMDHLREVNASPEDVVVIYVSTHGTLARDAKGSLERYLVTSDTRLEDVRHTGLLLADLETELDALPSRRKVLILATCHSGAGKSLLPPEVLKELEGTKGALLPSAPLEDASRASIVLAACDWGETAREDETLENDIYTHFLVEALEKPADRNGDGAVTATEAHDYARRRTYEFTGGQQRPSAQIQEVGADPVILHGRIDRVGQPELFGYEAALDGFSVRVDGDEPELLPGALAIPPGSHRVQLAKGDGPDVYDGDVHVELGERVDLGDLVTHPEPLTSIMIAGGYQGFLSSSANSSVVGPGEAISLAVARDDLLARHLGLRADLDLAGGNRSVEVEPRGAAVPFFYEGVQVGLAAPYQVRWGPVGLEAGPRVGAVYVGRSFDLSAYHTTQSYLVVSPGLTAGVTLRLDTRWFLFARADASAEAVVVDGQTQWQGFGSAWGGVGFRP